MELVTIWIQKQSRNTLFQKYRRDKSSQGSVQNIILTWSYHLITEMTEGEQSKVDPFNWII